MVRIKEFYQTVLGISDAETLQNLTDHSRLETAARGSRVVSMGEKMEVLYFLLDGILRGYVVDENGQDITDCFICSTGDPVIGCGGFGAPSAVHIEAISPCQLLALPVCDLLALMERPEMMRLYCAQLEQALQRHWTLKMLLYRCDAMERYRWFLEKYPRLEHHVNGKHVASFLGMTPVTLSRLRRKLKNEG
ncbi:MAG: Crp/Fnr family transcriptional regulator [Clostridia bacterium]|nr:Crp/Fnr family transcriptional regulator [Clostridia bacterium]